MKLPGRSSSPPPAERTHNIFRIALRALVAQRMARRTAKHGLRTYKFVRRLPWLIGSAVIGFLLFRKLRGSETPATPSEPWTAPPVTPPAPIQTSGTGNSTPEPEPEPEPEDVPPTPAAPQAGVEAKGGPDLPSEGDGAPDPVLSASAAATDAGTTGGGTKAVEDDA